MKLFLTGFILALLAENALAVRDATKPFVSRKDRRYPIPKSRFTLHPSHHEVKAVTEVPIKDATESPIEPEQELAEDDRPNITIPPPKSRGMEPKLIESDLSTVEAQREFFKTINPFNFIQANPLKWDEFWSTCIKLFDYDQCLENYVDAGSNYSDEENDEASKLENSEKYTELKTAMEKYQ